MNVVVPPVLVGGRILRIVSSTPHLYEVEEWVGEWWEPSSVTLSVATAAQAATSDEMDAQGVPEAERFGGTERLSIEQLSEHMRAPVRAYDIDIAKLLASPAEHGVRRREYAGSAKFRRPRALKKEKDKRRGGDNGHTASDWAGPFRRATDITHDITRDMTRDITRDITHDITRDTPPSTP